MVIENNPKKMTKSLKRSQWALVARLLVLLFLILVIFLLSVSGLNLVIYILLIIMSVIQLVILWQKLREHLRMHRTDHHIYLAKEGVDLHYGHVRTAIPWGDIQGITLAKQFIILILHSSAPYAERRYKLHDVYEVELDELNRTLRHHWAVGHDKQDTGESETDILVETDQMVFTRNRSGSRVVIFFERFLNK